MMDMKSMTIATKVEKVILPHLIEFAHFRINDKEDDDRGRFLFVPVQSPKLLEYEEKGIY